MEMNNADLADRTGLRRDLGARPGARREWSNRYIKRLKEMEDMALAYPGVMKTYAIQAGRELRVIVGARRLTDQEAGQPVARHRQEDPGRNDLSGPGEDHRHPRNPRRIVREIRTPPVGQAAHGLPAANLSQVKIPPQNGGIFLSTALLPVSSGTQRQLIRDRIHTQSPDSRHGKGHKPLTRRRGGAASGIISSCYAS